MTNDWAKAGLMVSNDITKAGGSPGYLILAVTPEHGVALQWDDNGDGQLDTNTSTNEKTPVVPTELKLVRDGNTYTGYYSTDGQTWKTVGSATLSTAAATQDVGVFTSSHNIDTIGVSDFSGFNVD